MESQLQSQAITLKRYNRWPRKITTGKPTLIITKNILLLSPILTRSLL